MCLFIEGRPYAWPYTSVIAEPMAELMEGRNQIYKWLFINTRPGGGGGGGEELTQVGKKLGPRGVKSLGKHLGIINIHSRIYILYIHMLTLMVVPTVLF